MSSDRCLNMSRVDFKAIVKEKEFWFLIVLWIVYCYRPLFFHDTFFFRDVTYFFFPQKQLFANLVKGGEVPLWDLFHHGGHPYLADINNSPLYPTNLLYLFLPAVKAFNLTIVLHYMLCSASAYIFARILGLRPVSSFISGVVYGFCGYTLSLNDHNTRLFAIALLPLIFSCWHLFLLEQRRKFFVATVLFGVLQVILGAPEVNSGMMLVLLGWTLCYPFPYYSWRRKTLLWILLGLCLIGLSAFQLLPTLEAASQSARGEGLDYGVFAQWSLYPGRLPEMVFPAFRGHIDRLPYDVYFWGGDLGDKGYPYIPNIYFGLLSLALALFGAFAKNRSSIPLRIRIFLFGVFLITVILALGRFWPWFPLLYRYVPGISLFRYPIKFLLSGLLPLALLTGCGADMLFDSRPTSHRSSKSSIRWGLLVLWGLAGVLAGFSVFFWYSADFAAQVQEFLFMRPGTEISHRGLSASFGHTAAIWFLLAMLTTYHLFERKAWHSWALAVIFVFDLLSAGMRVIPLAPERFFTSEPPLVDIVRNELGDGKLYRAPDPLPHMFYVPPDNPFGVPQDHVMWLYRWQLETLRKYLGANYHIPVMFHHDYNKMGQRRLLRLAELIEALPWERRLPLLSAGNVSLVLTSDRLELPGLELLEKIPNLSDQPLFLYKNTHVAPPIGLITQWEYADSDKEAEEWMLKADFDPRRHVVIQQPNEDFFSMIADLGQKPAFDRPPHARRCDRALNVDIQERERHHTAVTLSVTSHCGGYLVFSEQWYPGWRVSIDGEPVSVKRANLAFSAVWLDPGTHEVRRYYTTNIFFLGILCSLICCSGMAVLIVRKWR